MIDESHLFDWRYITQIKIVYPNYKMFARLTYITNKNI